MPGQECHRPLTYRVKGRASKTPFEVAKSTCAKNSAVLQPLFKFHAALISRNCPSLVGSDENLIGFHCDICARMLLWASPDAMLTVDIKNCHIQVAVQLAKLLSALLALLHRTASDSHVPVWKPTLHRLVSSALLPKSLS